MPTSSHQKPKNQQIQQWYKQTTQSSPPIAILVVAPVSTSTADAVNYYATTLASSCRLIHLPFRIYTINTPITNNTINTIINQRLDLLLLFWLITCFITNTILRDAKMYIIIQWWERQKQVEDETARSCVFFLLQKYRAGEEDFVAFTTRREAHFEHCWVL